MVWLFHSPLFERPSYSLLKTTFSIANIGFCHLLTVAAGPGRQRSRAVGRKDRQYREMLALSLRSIVLPQDQAIPCRLQGRPWSRSPTSPTRYRVNAFPLAQCSGCRCERKSPEERLEIAPVLAGAPDASWRLLYTARPRSIKKPWVFCFVEHNVSGGMSRWEYSGFLASSNWCPASIISTQCIASPRPRQNLLHELTVEASRVQLFH
jgi:hypothetical protein